ncbi:hypothetical protein [Serratia liquefaciens]|uniref:Uncharacterized protein n=1 Tax=Serratia liquefaciens TaxID=614 RepID=A0A515CRM6_SERLI|nr:hypothetical protein [Serratia liquefaciens]QDL30773.1 hypothetical protein EGO53_02755 [Serratia liquefaciens]
MKNILKRAVRSVGSLLDLLPSADYTKLIDKRPAEKAIEDDWKAVGDDMWSVLGGRDQVVSSKQFLKIPPSELESASFVSPNIGSKGFGKFKVKKKRS